MVTATFITEIPHGRGSKKLWQLSEPITVNEDDYSKYTSYVVTSAITTWGGTDETFIFPADEKGHVLSWQELPGSFDGAKDHERAIYGAGWEITGRQLRADFFMDAAPIDWAYAEPDQLAGVNDEENNYDGQPYDQKVEEVKEDELAISLTYPLDE